jgi:trehalose synthase-fused probable maltokinase
MSLLEFMRAGSTAIGENGAIIGVRGKLLDTLPEPGESKVLKVEQSNSSVIFSDPSGRARLFVKLFRKLEEGINPDVEITRFLSERQRFPQVPAFGGTVEYRGLTGEPRLVAMALGIVENRGDAWAFTLREVTAFFERVRRQAAWEPVATVGDLLWEGAEPEVYVGLIGSFANRARQLGVRTGQMHLALADGSEDPHFNPEAITHGDVHALAEEIRTSGKRAWGLLNAASARAAAGLDSVTDLREMEQKVMQAAADLENATVGVTKIRTHGDYHLGQVLETDGDFVIIDFEGEPLRPLAERQAKRSPLRDVAGMLRSFHYAAHSGNQANLPRLVPWAEGWSDVIGRIFLRAWLQTVDGASFVPQDRAELALLLNAFLLEKALYEVAYELNNRPEWVGIPLRGLAKVLGIKPT